MISSPKNNQIKNDNWLANSDDNEFLDIVDNNDNVVGQKTRADIYSEGKSNFRVINAFIENTRGQLWVLRRSSQKHYFPLALDMSVGGHVKSGESYDDAFKRELLEELKIDLSDIQHCLLGYLTPPKNKVSSYMKVYKIFSDKTPQFNTNEFIEGFWLTPFEIARKINAGESAKDDLLRLLHIFYRDCSV